MSTLADGTDTRCSNERISQSGSWSRPNRILSTVRIRSTRLSMRGVYEHDKAIFFGQNGLINMPGCAQMGKDKTHFDEYTI